MATPFDHMESFKSLDPDTKDQIMSKFKDMPPEKQQEIMLKANTPMQLRASEGAEPIAGPITAALTLGAGGTQAGMEGANLATRVATNIYKSPERTIEAATSVGKMALQGIKNLGGAIGEAASTIGENLSGVTDAIKNTGAKDVSAITTKMAEAPIKNVAKSELANTVLKEAGTGIGEAEKAMGIDQSNTSTTAIRMITKSPDNIAKFADKASTLADKGAEALAKAASPETLQFYRKAAQASIDTAGDSLPTLAKNKLYNISKVFGDAISKTEEGAQAGYDTAMSKYSDAMKVVNELPKQFAAQKRALKLALVHAQNLAETQKPLRTAAKYVGSGVLAATGYGAVKKAIRE